MKVIMEIATRKCTIEDSEAVYATDALDLAVAGLVGVGFHGDSVRDAVVELGEALQEKEGSISCIETTLNHKEGA